MVFISGDNNWSVLLRFWIVANGRRICASHCTKHESRCWGKSDGLHCDISEQPALCTRDCGHTTVAEEATVVFKAHKWILWTCFKFDLHMYNIFDAFTMQQIFCIFSNNYISGSLRKIYYTEQDLSPLTPLVNLFQLVTCQLECLDKCDCWH